MSALIIGMIWTPLVTRRAASRVNIFALRTHAMDEK